MIKRNIQFLLTALILGATFSLTAQDEIYAAVNTADYLVDIDGKELTASERTISQNNLEGVEQLRAYLAEHVDYPDFIYDFARGGKVFVDVDLSATGKILGSRTHGSFGKNVSAQIADLLQDLGQVEPIVIQGTPQSRTVRLPIVFKGQ